MPSKPITDPMSAQEFGELRAFLAQKGVSQAKITEAVGSVTGTRAEIVERLRAWLYTRPKRE